MVAAAVREPLPPAYAPPPSALAVGGAMGVAPLWAACWERCRLETLPGFPLWTYEVHEMLRDCFAELRRIFSHYTVEDRLDEGGAPNPNPNPSTRPNPDPGPDPNPNPNPDP